MRQDTIHEVSGNYTKELVVFVTARMIPPATSCLCVKCVKRDRGRLRTMATRLVTTILNAMKCED